MKRISMAHSALVGTLALTTAAQPLLVYAQNPALAPVPDQRAQASLDGKFSLADALTGARVGAEKLSIRVFQNGRVIKTATTSAEGAFRVDNLATGIYSFVANGPDGFYASSHQVTTGGSSFDATVVHPVNVPVIAKLIRNQLGVAPRTGSISFGDPAVNVGGGAPAGVTQTPVFRLANDGHLRIRAKGIRNEQAAREAAAPSTMYFLQSGSVVAEAKADATGAFDLSGIVAGEYSMLIVTRQTPRNGVAGPLSPGVVAFGVRVDTAASSGPDVVKGQNSDESFVATALLQDPGTNDLNGVDSVPPETLPPLAGPPVEEVVGPPQMVPGGGGFGGGMGGGAGGGGGFGGGGMLGLLGLGAGLAGLGVALANDNNGGSSTPASPATP